MAATQAEQAAPARREPLAVSTPVVLGAALVSALLVAAAVLWAGGAIDARALPGLPDAGTVTPWALPLLRVLGDLAAAVTVGCLLATAFAVPGRVDERGRRRVSPHGYRWLRAAAVSAATWAVATVGALVFTLSDLLGRPVSLIVTPTSLWSFVTTVQQGRSLLLVALGAAVLAVAARTVLSPTSAAVLAVFAIATAMPPVFSGHAASAGNHQVAVSTMLLHLAGVLIWTGGLVALLLGRRLPTAELSAAAHRYSRAALWCFVAVAVSGMANAWVRLPSLGDLTGTSYGRLVLVKAAALVALGTVGWLHRGRTLPALAAGRRAAFARLAAVEVLLMAATIGVAVGLSRTPTPGAGPATDRTTELLGYPMPGPISPGALLADWLVEPLYATLAVTAIAVYLAGVLRLHRRGDRWPPQRTAAWVAGWLVVLVVSSSGLARYGPVLFSVHMIQHMALTMLAPVMLVLGGPITLGLRALRPSTDPALRGPREWLLAIVHSRVSTLLTHPLIALAIYVSSLYAMYFTGVYELTLRSHLAHLLMFAHFLLAGSLFFWILIGIDPAPRQLDYPVRIPLLFVSMVFHAFFGVAIMQSGAVIAADWYSALHRPWGGTPLADQGVGGGIAWAFGEAPSLLVMGSLFFQWARSDEREQRRLDRAADRAEARQAAVIAGGSAPEVDDDDPLAAYNRQLRALADADAAQDRAARLRQR
ncbi:MAG: copper resistance domain protein [Mycobacterium sp.]|nr:copper resistance domain protein [Mycobacterium sp.]